MGYVVPFERNVKMKSPWSLLVEAFPAPSYVQDKLTSMKMKPPKFDCFGPLKFICPCYKCVTGFDTMVDEFELVQRDMERCVSPIPDIVPKIDVKFENAAPVPIAPVTGLFVKHYYLYQPDVLKMDPDTPYFSEVRFDKGVKDAQTPNKAWVKRRHLVVTPTQLIFKR